MKNRRKHPYCLNCNSPLKIQDDFCPKCGQENSDQNISVGLILSEFISNTLALDGKLPKSIIPFLFYPGKLTNTFNSGKRNTYFNPIRMYLVLSLFYFFVIGYLGKKIASEIEIDKKKLEQELSEENRQEVLNVIDSTLDSKLSNVENKDSIRFAIEKEIDKRFPDSTSRNKLGKTFSLDLDSLGYAENDTTTELWEKVYFLANNNDLTIENCMDSLDINKSEKVKYTLAYQAIKVIRSDKTYLVGYILKNLPIMMFILLPLFALILKILYINTNFLYINHIIHGLYLHSFAYFIYGLSIFLIINFSITPTIAFYAFIVVTTYCYISFLKVYKQGWFKTFIKFNFLGFLYISLLSIAFIMELSLSLYLF
ncbi:DUF3667 domain-containing protein [Marinigracilibium pacificum]|uniref:DUF3667 domain-containing protein n=1 Tax=Marinigracilibium pacificum TaxID=2729599 RepID=A0A848J741_9BACT|nr:DUF3667 domain-containing protein [Marinigracilibium pacificum]NMM50254.1 DUF3667 domain-containing protein [Marinigracilibium pacificum]